MNIENNQAFKAILITKGRKTGKPHSVMLRAVMYNNKFYFSRRNSNSDWLKNALAESSVKVKVDDLSYEGIAKLVTDKSLARRISEIKYSDSRAEESRVILEVSKL